MLKTIFFTILASSIWMHTCAAQGVSQSVRVALDQIDNVGFVWTEDNEFDDLALSLSYAGAAQRPINLTTAINWGWLAESRYYQDWSGNFIDLGTSLGMSRKLGIGFDRPILSLAIIARHRWHESSAQNTFNSRMELGLARPLNDYLDFSLSLAAENNTADSSLSAPMQHNSALMRPADDPLDRSWYEALISMEAFVSGDWSIPVSLRYLDGDLLSISSSQPQMRTYIDALAVDNKLPNPQYLYRYQGSSWTLSLVASRLLKNGSTINFGVDYTNADTVNDTSYEQTRWSANWVYTW